MRLTITLSEIHYNVRLDRPRSLAIALHFNGDQPNFFDAPPATATPFTTGAFSGDTARGASCNVQRLHLIPHCNGTHTESVAHIVHQSVPVFESLARTLSPAFLLTVAAVAADRTTEHYRPAKQPSDRLITRASLRTVLERRADAELEALILRTLPNDESKQYRNYDAGGGAPFFSVEAVDYLVERRVRHLLVDFPSIDRTHDEGRLTNHHLFWRLPEGTHDLTPAVQGDKTISEMLYIAHDIVDGLYLLDLQVPAFMSDAAPCRPVIYPLEPLR